MKTYFFKSLKLRMPLLVLSGIIPLISLAIFIAIERASSTIAKEALENLELKSELLAESVESWDESNVLALLNLSKQTYIVEGNVEKQKKILQELVNTYAHLSLASTIDKDGWNIARSDDLERKYYGDRQYFQAAMQGNNVNYQILLSRTNNEPNLCISSPIEKSEEIIGVSAICTDLKTLTQQVGQLQFGETGYAFVVDRNGFILVHPNLQYLSKGELTNFSQYPPVRDFLNGNKNNDGYIFFEDKKGVTWVAHSTRNANGWGVFVIQEKTEFFQNQQQFQNLAILIGAVAILGTSALTFILANRTIGPIADISDAAIDIAKGELNRRVSIKRQDELGILAVSFNQMANQLNDSFEKLNQAKEEAIAADRAKDRFIANISHELRTPLNGILGYSKLLKRQLPLDSRQVEEFNIIEKSGMHLLTLINDLLDFSKNQANKMELYSSNLNLPKFLKGVVGIVSNQAEEKGLELTTKFENLPAEIEADEKRLRQILINLLNNAIKFTEQGTVMLRVTGLASKLTETGIKRQKIRFEVIDTGVGIGKLELTKIFKPFEQTGALRLRNVGTGLGLSISQQLVRLMGGNLEVKSKLGMGSNFWFETSFAIANGSLRFPRELKIEQLSGYKGKERKILVVDDKKANRWLLVNILEPLGFKVLTAENGEVMFDIIGMEQPDLICLDLFMPKKTGFTSLKQLRALPGFENIPIVVVSATAITEEMRSYLKCDAFISKPVDEGELLLTLQKYLRLQWTYKSEQKLSEII